MGAAARQFKQSHAWDASCSWSTSSFCCRRTLRSWAGAEWTTKDVFYLLSPLFLLLIFVIIGTGMGINTKISLTLCGSGLGYVARSG